MPLYKHPSLIGLDTRRRVGGVPGTAGATRAVEDFGESTASAYCMWQDGKCWSGVGPHPCPETEEEMMEQVQRQRRSAERKKRGEASLFSRRRASLSRGARSRGRNTPSEREEVHTHDTPHDICAPRRRRANKKKNQTARRRRPLRTSRAASRARDASRLALAAPPSGARLGASAPRLPRARRRPLPRSRAAAPASRRSFLLSSSYLRWSERSPTAARAQTPRRSAP